MRRNSMSRFRRAQTIGVAALLLGATVQLDAIAAHYTLLENQKSFGRDAPKTRWFASSRRGDSRMRYAFHIVDVFSSNPFGGNQLAVLPDAAGISAAGMQKIAREFNFSETTFVLPKRDPAITCQVRIFTPREELDFAGHPTIGTACALVMTRHEQSDESVRLIFEENIGLVTVDVVRRNGGSHGKLSLSGKVETPPGAPSPSDLAAILSVEPPEVSQVFFASVGLPICFVQLSSNEVVDRAAINHAAWVTTLARAWSPHVFFFAGDLGEGGSLYARMSAPALGIEEDPATGSACAALVGAMASRFEFQGSVYRLSIQQGVSMGRPSEIEAEARKDGDVVTSVSVSGATAYIAAGEIEVPASDLAS